MLGFLIVIIVIVTGLVIYSLAKVASLADRQEEQYFAEKQEK